MVTQRRYPALSSDSSRNPLKVAVIIVSVCFLGFFVYGLTQIYNELRSISDGQQQLILNLTASATNQPASAETEVNEDTKGEHVSKVEFLKFRNETRKTIREMAKDLRVIKTQLKMKQTVLDDY